MARHNDNTDSESQSESQETVKESMGQSEFLDIGDKPDKTQFPSAQPVIVKSMQDTVTIEGPGYDEKDVTGDNNSSANPHSMEPFDWGNYETRFNAAMIKANEAEAALLQEFRDLVEVSNVMSYQNFNID